MVLEGYLPQEWWTAVMESTPLLRSVVVDGHTSPIPSLVLTDDGRLPVHLLLEFMWGGNSSKPQMQSQQTASDNGNNDDFMELAAACSVLIYIDEDNFLVKKSFAFCLSEIEMPLVFEFCF